MKIGVFIESFKKDFNDALDTASKMGVDGFQTYVGTKTIYTGMPKVEIKALKDKISSKGMEISAFCGDVGCHMFYKPDEMRAEIDEQKRVVDLAYAFGIKYITTHIGVIPNDKNHPHYAVMYKVYKELADYAGSAGVRFVIETGPEPSKVLKAFLDDVNSKGAGVNFDPANLVMVHNEDPVQAVYNLKDYIYHTHAKDGVCYKLSNPLALYIPDIVGIEPQPEGEYKGYYLETPLGEGQVNWKAYLNALTDIGYNGFLTIEREVGEDPTKDIGTAVQFLKKLI